MSRLIVTDRVLLYQSGSALFEDDCTEADTTTIDNSVPEIAVNGAIWVDDGTEALVAESNKMSSVNVTGVDNCFAFVNVQNEDLTIDATMQSSDATLFGRTDLIVRYIDKLNYKDLLT